MGWFTEGDRWRLPRQGSTISVVPSPTSTLRRLLEARPDANVRFRDLTALLVAMGFHERIRGSHHIYTRQGIPDILNLQPRGSMAKPYQVKQVRSVILRYGLIDELDTEV